MRVAASKGIVDAPGGYKAQHGPIPYLGGIAIVVAFVAVVLCAAFLRPPLSGLDELTALLLIGMGLAIVGLVDDLRGLGPFLRLALQVGSAVLVLFNTNVSVRLFDGGGPIDSVLTVVWIVGITNAFNLLDNMDGLSAGIATITALSIGLIASTHGQFLVAALSFALAGCAVGFLRHNIAPATIYMGDAGSLFLGFMVSVLAIRLRFAAPVQITSFIPLVVFAVPILDTTLVTITRIRHGRSPFAGGRDHLSHRLVFIGLSVRSAVFALYFATGLLGWIGLAIASAEVATGNLLVSLVFTVALAVGVILGRVPVYSNSRGRKIMLQVVDKDHKDYRHEHDGAGRPLTRSGGQHVDHG